MKKGQGKIHVKHLFVAIIIASAILQGQYRDWAVFSILAIFFLYNTAVHFFPKWRRVKLLKPQPAEKQKPSPQPLPPKPVQQTIPLDFQVIMLRHINFRITEKLHGAGYADASWHWCCKSPLTSVLKCGAARIRTFDTGDKNYADVLFSANGRISIRLMQIEELESGGTAAATKEARASDLGSWYDVMASRTICKTIDEVAACGNRKLFINESGEVYIVQNGQKNVQCKIASMPEKEKWQELIPLFADDDIAASINKDALVLSWKS